MTDALFDVAGRVVVVTGGTSGIGEMIARGFVERGATVYVSSRKADACQRVTAELGALGTCHGFAADLSTAEGAHALQAAVGERERRVDVLVNSAGATWGAPLEQYPDEAFEKVLTLNVRSPFRLVVAFLGLLRAAAHADGPARVINIGSVEGSVVPSWENYAYPASKAALHMLTRQLARRLAPERITVNAIAPGPFPSRMISFATEDRELWAQIEAEIPLGRAGRAEDAVGAAVFLAAPASAYLTGDVIAVDGGLTGAGRMS